MRVLLGASLLTSLVLIYSAGKMDTHKVESLSVYELAYQAKSAPSGPQTILASGEISNGKTQLEKSWKVFNEKLDTLPITQVVSNLVTLNSEHKFLMKEASRLNYRLSLKDEVNPAMKVSISQMLKKSIGSLTEEDIEKLKTQRRIWNKLLANSNSYNKYVRL